MARERTDERARLRAYEAVIRLGLGLEPPPDLDWEVALNVAIAERCAPLAWVRSGPLIRRLAPGPTSAAWRGHALNAVEQAQCWTALMEATVAELVRAELSPVVLKGIPLAQRLYGDTSARPCADLDLFVPLRERGTAHRVLRSIGWVWRAGTAPFEGCYVTEVRGSTTMLEVHSRLLDDGLVSHLPFLPPRASHERIGDRVIPVHDDDQLPAYLATHLAKHGTAPLLWLIDFATLWDSLDAGARGRARVDARRARAHRYLDWGLARASQLRLAAAGDDTALAAFASRAHGRVGRHNAVRVASLAATPFDALRTCFAWLIPRETRLRPAVLAQLVARRIGKLLNWSWVATNILGAGAPDSSSTEQTSLPRVIRTMLVDSEQLGLLVSQAIASDADFVIAASGNSMRPSIPPGALIKLSPLRGQRLRKGDVVLAMPRPGSFMVHRIRGVREDAVILQGDANVVADPPVQRSAVLAVADGLMVNGALRRIPSGAFARPRAWARRVLCSEKTPRAAGGAFQHVADALREALRAER